MCNAVSLFRSTTCSSSQRLCWLPSITIMFITFTSLYLTHSLLFSDNQLFHFVETNLLYSWSKILAFLTTGTPNPFTLFLNPASSLFDPPPPRSQWQSTFPPPPHLMDSHLHGKHWVHFLWGARIEEEEEWILKPRTGNIWLVLSLKELQNDQGGRVSETSLPSFGQLQVNASIFLRQTLSICIISLVLILDMWLLSFLTKVLQHKPFTTVYTPFSLKKYCQWQFVTQIFLIWKSRLY